ncbi:MAG: TRAM domain-containing protein [Chloroflexota bacterium]|nr:TRAM domain-containing protein [Chloroflexota bacterium]
MAGRARTVGGARLPAGESRVGRVVETTVERIVPGGAGLAFAEGRTVFVDLAAPGDRVRVRIDREQGRTGFGSIMEILEPSPVRVEPPHPDFIRCGGADFQHLTYDGQLEAKVGIVEDCLRRIGRIDPPGPISIIPSPQVWNYRARVEWQHDAQAGRLGYFEANSRTVCDVRHCSMTVPELNDLLADLRRRLEVGELPADVKEFHAASGDGGVALSPPLNAEQGTELERVIADERYRFDAETFFQVNPFVLDSLVREALRFTGAAVGHEETVDRAGRARGLAVDLFCGVGLFTVPLARRYRRVIGIESHRGAAAFATRNLEEAEQRYARVETARVDEWLRARAGRLAPAAFVLLDPPRTGIDRATIAGLLRLRAPLLTYVSCDPATLARDLRGLLDGGYRLDAVVALDLFPQTHHVEVVAHLLREEDGVDAA